MGLRIVVNGIEFGDEWVYTAQNLDAEVIKGRLAKLDGVQKEDIEYAKLTKNKVRRPTVTALHAQKKAEEAAATPAPAPSPQPEPEPEKLQPEELAPKKAVRSRRRGRPRKAEQAAQPEEAKDE